MTVRGGRPRSSARCIWRQMKTRSARGYFLKASMTHFGSTQHHLVKQDTEFLECNGPCRSHSGLLNWRKDFVIPIACLGINCQRRDFEHINSDLRVALEYARSHRTTSCRRTSNEVTCNHTFYLKVGQHIDRQLNGCHAQK